MRVQCAGCRGLILVLMLAAPGCAKGKPVKFDGLVTLDEKPLAGATVEFIPMDANGHGAIGVSGKDGVFRLTTYTPGDGALPGFYKATVRKQPGGDSSDTPAGPPTGAAEAKAMYVKRAKQITQGQNQAKRKPLFPAMYSDDSKTPLRC